MKKPKWMDALASLFSELRTDEQRMSLEQAQQVKNAPLPQVVQDAVGKNIKCYDGSTHICQEITPSYRYPWFYVINEQDPESNAGYFVSVYSLTLQVEHNKPAPERAEDDYWIREVFSRVTGLRGDQLLEWGAGNGPGKSKLELVE